MMAAWHCLVYGVHIARRYVRRSSQSTWSSTLTLASHLHQVNPMQIESSTCACAWGECAFLPRFVIRGVAMGGAVALATREGENLFRLCLLVMSVPPPTSPAL